MKSISLIYNPNNNLQDTILIIHVKSKNKNSRKGDEYERVLKKRQQLWTTIVSTNCNVTKSVIVSF